MVSMKSLFAAGACTALALGLPAQAAQPGWELTPGVTFERFDHNRHLKDAWGPRLGIGYNYPSKNFGLEAAFRYLNPDAKSSKYASANFYEGELDGLYYFLPNAPVEPYGLFGVAYDRFHPKRQPDSRRIAGVAGVGLLWQITPNWGIRGDIRAEHPLAGVDLWDGRAMLGLQYNFGVPSATVATTEAPPEPAHHRPPPDEDDDGVPDGRDQCPNTPPGAKVDNQGCQVYLKKPVTHTLHVQFNFNSAKIKNEYDSDIANLAHFLRQYPTTNTTLKGYADSTGPADYNLGLSQKRAEAVRNRLINKYNVAADRLKSKGFGEQDPVASNSTDAGRAQNRRVVAVSEAIKKVPAKKNNSRY